LQIWTSFEARVSAVWAEVDFITS